MSLSTLADRMSSLALRASQRILLALIAAPAFALYGLFMLALVYREGAKALRSMKRLSGSTIDCHHCRAPNALAGRWRCGKCRAEYHGFVGCCPLCSATARAFSCERCHITIPLALD